VRHAKPAFDLVEPTGEHAANMAKPATKCSLRDVKACEAAVTVMSGGERLFTTLHTRSRDRVGGGEQAIQMKEVGVISDGAEPSADLPLSVAAFVRATNAGDLAALVATFADHAMVNDQLREHWDKPAIAGWASAEIIAQRLVIRVRKAVRNHDHTVVEAIVDGNFDKRGLPEPLVVTFYFSVHRDQLVQLVILRNELGE
jgi:hypothetical protein